MNDSLDKLIGNDELLTYICLILAILNTFLMSIIINDIKHHFSIYIFSLFEALFLIFIIYFLLKKKDIYNKDYDIKYDWYFYLRISIIILVFFNFALYIYNISNFPPINPKKTGGVLGFLKYLGFKSNNKVSPIPPIAKEKTREELQDELKKLQIESKQLQESLKNTNENLKKNAKMNVIITVLIAKASSHKKDEAQQKSYSIKQNDIINNIAFLNSKLKEDTAKLNNNNNRCADIVKNLRELPAVVPAVAPAVVPAPVPAVPAVPAVAAPVDFVAAPINDRISILLTDPLFKDTLSASDLKELSKEDIDFLLNGDSLLTIDEELRKLEDELYVKEEAKDELKNLVKKEAKEVAKKEAKEKAKKEAKQIYKNIKKLVTKNNSSETDEPIKKAKDLATGKINEISKKIKEAKEDAKEAKKKAKDKGETKEERKKRINTERMAKNERYKDIMLEKILIKSLKDKLLKNIEEISKAIVLKNQDAPP